MDLKERFERFVELLAKCRESIDQSIQEMVSGAREAADAALAEALSGLQGGPAGVSTGRWLPNKAPSSLMHPARKKSPIQLCPMPGCANRAAPAYGMVCAQHKGTPKAEVKKYRDARRAAGLGSASPFKISKPKKVVKKAKAAVKQFKPKAVVKKAPVLPTMKAKEKEKAAKNGKSSKVTATRVIGPIGGAATQN